ncbi:MAG: hypothetical protein ACE5E5_03225 [Phycisphaerae bacterium]
MSKLQRACMWMGGRWFPIIPVALGMGLAASSLVSGIQADDLYIRSVVVGSDLLGDDAPSPWQPYTYLDGDPERNHRIVDRGWMPWWTDPRCKAALSRPLTALTFMLDYGAWPEYPVLMHLQSLVWYGLLITVVAVFNRRMMDWTMPAWVVVLATLLFAVDEAHAIPAGWLANRNALVAMFFGVLALIAHDRRRRDAWRAGMWLAPVAFLAALLAKEEAVSTGGYLLAYAIFLDRDRWSKRLTSLVPCLLAGILWYIWYRSSGYGVFASEVYIDPGHDPLRFASQVARNAPILLLGQWVGPPSDASLFLSPGLLRVHWLWAIGVLSVVGIVIRPLLLRDAVARFWCAGMLLAVLPVCAIFTNDRLLMFAGLGAMGLMAQWLTGLRLGAVWVPATGLWRRIARVCDTAFVGIHLILAPLAFPVGAMSMMFVGASLNSVYNTLPDDRPFANQTAVFVNALGGLADRLWIQTRHAEGRPVPQRTLNLSPSCSAVSITRTDARTLVVQPRGGYLQPRGWVPKDESPPPASLEYLAKLMDMMVRTHAQPMLLGQIIELSAVTIEITDLTEDGRPAEATFRFRVPLEDPSLRWLYLDDYRYRRFSLPAVGETVQVASPLS